jgi:hypothetical protein
MASAKAVQPVVVVGGGRVGRALGPARGGRARRPQREGAQRRARADPRLHPQRRPRHRAREHSQVAVARYVPGAPTIPLSDGVSLRALWQGSCVCFELGAIGSASEFVWHVRSCLFSAASP